MIEREVNIFESKLNRPPIDVENIDTVINLSFETVEVTSQYEEVRDNRLISFVRKRKLRRVKSAGIF